jgi:polysaccharide pyruvyl transferase WcaK-like protein
VALNAPKIAYTLLFGAIKNFGDFLIYERAKALLRKHTGMVDFLEIHGLRESLEDRLDQVNATKAVIICGGPGLQVNMYPGRYALTAQLSEIKIPIIVLGIGWFGVPGDDATVAQYRFTPTTVQLFDQVRNQGHSIAVRDHLSEEVLRRNNVTNVSMTGCPSWYDLDHVGGEFTPPSSVRTIAFTPPANQLFQPQSVEIMELLRSRFPNTRLICSFHRGIMADAETSIEQAAWYGEIARSALRLGYEVRDASYGLENAPYYDQCDLHVGYRVHGHILFLSQHKPSFLIEEDGRGRGVAEALGSPSVRGWERTISGKLAAATGSPRFSGILADTGRLIRANPTAAIEVDAAIGRQMGNDFAGFHLVSEKIRRHYSTMVEFLRSIP